MRVLLLAGLLSACAPTHSPRVLVIGDSITWSIPETAAGTWDVWPAKVQAALGSRAEVMNSGYAGGTSADGVRLARSGTYPMRFEVLVVSFGMNDATNGCISPDEYRANLLALNRWKTAVSPGARMMILGASSSDDPRRAPQLPALRKVAQQVAQDIGATYVDLSDAYSATDDVFVEPAGQRVHPTPEGHARLAALILRHLPF